MHAPTIFIAILGLAAKSLAAPIPTTAPAAAVEKRFQGGWCGVHVRAELVEDTARASVKLFDGAQFQLLAKDFEAKRGDMILANIPSGELPEAMSINILAPHDEAVFRYGDQQWGSGMAGSQNDRCKVGRWDHTGVTTPKATVDLDCGFSC
ncbi:hypothetical protein PG993_010573 [Apiospora rasikravindrae]|uniref:Uncharacterized protein n=1 Tax=Apiospora rasikravindrae TaxID=990691 RepID=A0ABR1SMN1_9PEZI